MGIYTGRSSKALKGVLIEAFGPRCLSCGAHDRSPQGPLTRDHVLPRCLGGTDCWANLQLLCVECNGRKASVSLDYRKEFPLGRFPLKGGRGFLCENQGCIECRNTRHARRMQAAMTERSA